MGLGVVVMGGAGFGILMDSIGDMDFQNMILIEIMTIQERCYVIYGNGFKPLKIKGMSNKNKLIDINYLSI